MTTMKAKASEGKCSIEAKEVDAEPPPLEVRLEANCFGAAHPYVPPGYVVPYFTFLAQIASLDSVQCTVPHTFVADAVFRHCILPSYTCDIPYALGSFTVVMADEHADGTGRER